MLPSQIADAFNRQVSRMGHSINYLIYDSSTTKNKYGESKKKQYLTPIPLKCIARTSPTQEELEEYGFDQDVEVIIKVPTPQLSTNNITPSLDDKIEYNGITYFINSKNEKGLWQNEEVFAVLGCGKVSENRGK